MTKIPYCDETLPLVRGCSKISPGCANCYAERNSHRFKTTTEPWISAYAYENVTLHREFLDKPLHWTRPRTIFVCPTGDLFHENVPDGFIDSVFAVMRVCERHRFLILTKRAERMHDYFCNASGGVAVESRVYQLAPGRQPKHWYHASDWQWPLPNVWLGVSAENRHWANERIPVLLKTPAAHRWGSFEPLLGPVDTGTWLGPAWECGQCGYRQLYDHVICVECHARGIWPMPHASSLDWVVVGGESGPAHRPMDLGWVQSIANQCWAAKVPFFGKQASGARPNAPLPWTLARRELPWS